jgi:hypothetical protein
MDSDNKMIGWIASLLVFLAISILSISLFYCYKKDVRMAELGYQKTTIVGTNFVYYQKVKEQGD